MERREREWRGGREREKGKREEKERLISDRGAV